MDAGFSRRRTGEGLDGERYGYVIVAKGYKPIKGQAQACQFTRLRNGWEGGEFRFQPPKWTQPRRFVVVRRPIPADPEEAAQPTLFKDTQYVYHGLVTHLRRSAWRLYRLYAPPARIEKHLREVVSDYPLAKIPTPDWLPNVAFFQLLLFAFDLLHYFKRLCLPRAYRYKTLKTIRMELLVLPGHLVHSKEQHRLTLPEDYHFRETFLKALTASQKLRLPASQ